MAKSQHQPVVLQWNCRGLYNKVGELKTKILFGKLHVWALLLEESNKLSALPHFIGYHTPSIPDRRTGSHSDKPGKAAIYVANQAPQTPVNLQRWCNQQQEVVAVLARPAKTPLLLVSFYGRPRNATLNLDWLHHIRTTYPGIPILIGGDFKFPDISWGYNYNSKRGLNVYEVFTDSNFTLLNHPDVATIAATRTHAPDLTWWLGPGSPSWTPEPDGWGSDHSPILIGVHTMHLKKLRLRIRVTHWDKVRSDDRAKSLDTTTLISTLQSILADSTTLTTVDVDQPTPDLPLLKLWAERRQAEIQANPDRATSKCERLLRVGRDVPVQGELGAGGGLSEVPEGRLPHPEGEDTSECHSNPKRRRQSRGSRGWLAENEGLTGNRVDAPSATSLRVTRFVRFT
ncbi:hypothetical protein ISCGN_002090 [Ixodes scapularis]